ncbi:MAG: hypothetical protein UY03_C0040G0002 [Parcubacteria group bacterium GW2011_GWA2_47_64]|nr:MAG: hypothetical protein UY03_C0040G0002 [Parcubacteria group bacterium GW2011_GWA2_47_64]
MTHSKTRTSKRFRFSLGFFPLCFLLLFIFSLSTFHFQSASADITTDLVSHYKLDETSGTTATDSAGTNNGTLTNSPTWTTGKLNNALNFDGTNDYVTIGDIFYSDIFTVCAWFKSDVMTGSTGKTIVAKRNSSGITAGTNEWSFSIDAGTLQFISWNSGGGVTHNIGYNTALTANTWYHGCAVQSGNGNTGYVYLNGVVDASASQTSAMINSASLIQVGVRIAGSDTRYFDGIIDDIRIYSRALTAADITQLYSYTGALPPVSTTNSATSLTSTTATLNATVNPNNLSTTAYFQYGWTSAYGNTTPAQTLTGSANQNITASIASLDSNTVYYYRAVALTESVWNLAESISRPISGTNNNTTTFQTLWDDNYLYIAYKVLDSNLINDSTNNWMDDSVELYIDPDNSKSTTYDTYDRQFVKGYNDSALAAPQNGTGVLHNTASIAGGYTVELAIPWSNLGVAPSANMTLGFDLQQNDDDTGGDIQNAMGWNSTTGTNYKNTSAFGTLALSSQTVGTAQSSSSSVSQSSSSSATAADTTPPIVSISSPTTNTTYSTSASTIDVSGTASDNVSISSVTCAVNGSSCGVVSGATFWSITSIPLIIGTNTIIVTARDAANNTSTDTLTVTRTTTTTSSNVWQRVPIRTKAQQTAGLVGGEGSQFVFAMNYAPSDSQIMYLVRDTNSVWKSEDGGATWGLKDDGIQSRGGVSIVVNPYDKNVVLMAGSLHATDLTSTSVTDGIYRTADGGSSWTRTRDTHYMRNYWGDMFAFGNTSTVYAGTKDQGLLKSTDGGVTWSSLNLLTSYPVRDIKIHPTDATTLFVANTNGLYKITGSGGSATKIGTGLFAVPQSISINQSSPNTIYVTTGRSGAASPHNLGGVYKSTDGGVNFTRKSNGLDSLLGASNTNYTKRLAISPVDPNRLYVAFELSGSPHPFYTINAGENWIQPIDLDVGDLISDLIYADSGVSPRYQINQVIAHPTATTNAFTLNNKACPIKTTNSGSTWTYSGNGLTGSNAEGGSTSFGWDVNNVNRYVLFFQDSGPYITRDGGSTFIRMDIPAGVSNGRTTPAGALDPTVDSEIVITAVDSWGSQEIIVTTDEGASWVKKGYSSSFSFIAFDPNNPNVVYANNYRSTNKGSTWGTISKSVIAMYSGTQTSVYAYSTTGGITTVSRSDDTGTTWSSPYGTFNAGTVYELSIDPTNKNILYAATSQGVYKYNGSSWSQKVNGLTVDGKGSIETRRIAIDPNNPSVIYAAKYAYLYGPSNGVFRSIDGGETWSSIIGNLGPEFTAMSLSVNPNSSYVYLGSASGTWRLPPPGTVTTADTTPPSVSITSPTTVSTYSTTASTVALSGTASDTSGISSVTCAVNGSSCGTVSGTTSWSVSNIPLVVGTNTIIITARDSSANGNTSTATLSVTRTTTTTSSSSSSSAPLPTLTVTASKTLSPITIDGALSESVWNLTEPIARTISGTNNNTATFSTLWNDTYLYLAYKVLDSNLINDSTYPWQDDSVELYLDGQHERSLTYDGNDRQFVQGYNDTTLAALQNGTGVLHNTTSIVGGYTIELAIPWTNLGITSPTANQTLGFDLQQNDDDTGGDVQNALGWNSTTGANYKNTSAFGTLALSSQTVGTAQSSSSSAASQSSSAQSSVSSPSSSSQSSATQSSSASSAKFITGDRVITTTDTLNVRSSASLTGTALGAQSLNQAGTIVSGPVSSGGYNWYDVNYDTAPDGWSVENYLEKAVSSSSSSSQSSSVPSQSSSSSLSSATSGGGGGGGGGGSGGGGGGIYIPPVSYESTLKTIASSTKPSAATATTTEFVNPFVSLESVFRPFVQIFTQDLKIGSRSAQVKTLQEKLSADKTLYPEGLTTGYYGSLTQAAVKRFQKKHNLAATGSIDLKTRAKLNEIYGSNSSKKLSKNFFSN